MRNTLQLKHVSINVDVQYKVYHIYTSIQLQPNMDVHI